MSSTLLADQDEYYNTSGVYNPGPEPIQNGQAQNDWGDFESSEQGLDPPQTVLHFAGLPSNDDGFNPWADAASVEAPRKETFIDTTSNHDEDLQQNSPERHPQSSSPEWDSWPSEPQTSRSPAAVDPGPAEGDVLFDADDFDDDFGDFEEWSERKPIEESTVKRPEQLVDLESHHGHAHVSSSGMSNAFAEYKSSNNNPVDPASQIYSNSNDEDSMLFSGWPSLLSSSSSTYQPSNILTGPSEHGKEALGTPPAHPSEDPDPKLSQTRKDASIQPPKSSPSVSPQMDHPTNVPPTNIPPPSLLLSLFLPIFDSPQPPQPTTSTRSLQGPSHHFTMLSTSIVAAHIIAGRKLRWKRDTVLSQSTKIGPAGSSKARGMKLTGVDRTEAIKEEREVAEVVRAWKQRAGGLRSAVARAGTVGPVPRIEELMVVRTAKQNEGGVSAPKACALCGLRREERVVNADGAVEDSFGEWWVEYWGHRSCRSFWEEHKGDLLQR